MKHIVVALIFTFALFQLSAQNKKANNVSLLLPFCSKQILANPNCKDAELGNICREYYQGGLIALDSLERAGVKLKLNVFDTENDSLTMLSIMQTIAFKESELILGPVRQGGNQVLSQFCKKNEVYHFSPLMTFSKIKMDDPYWISANPDLPVYAGIILKQILTSDTAANIIVVYDKSTVGKSIGQAFKTIAANKKLRLRVLEYNPTLDLKLYTSDLYANHIVVAAIQESSVNGTLRNMGDTSTTYKLTTYGLMQWFDFKNVDYTLYQRFNLSVFSPFYADYTHDEVKQFVVKYRERFSTEPTEAAIKGYDQMLLFTNALNQNGKKLMDKLADKNIPALGTRFNFIRYKESNSYQTVYLNLLKLDNYALKKVN